MREIVHLHIEAPVCSVVERLTGTRPESVFLEKPKNTEFGDYATNIAMISAKRAGRDPKKLAKEIKKAIQENDEEGFFSRIDIAGPGFINFFVSAPAVINMVNHLVNSDDYLSFPIADSPQTIIEFVSANPTGPLHVGHGRGAAFGDSLARVLRFTGRRVTTEYYVNDVGRQIEVLGRSLYLRYLECMGKKVEFPDDHYRGEYLKEIAKEVREKEGNKYLGSEGDTPDFFLTYGMGRILEGIREDLERFNVQIDSWFGEETLYASNEVDRSINLLKEKGCVYEKDGAIWFKSTLFGDDKDRVIVRANNQKTYFASDIAYHLNKQRRGFGEMIDIWGADHHGYVPRLRA
ncbi:MAG: arginine--tRNA ligase, partial [Deltaproteobacteria bacterium]|nr:arginine--tRNA ligase [Deltaproteobacteria bacterium]